MRQLPTLVAFGETALVIERVVEFAFLPKGRHSQSSAVRFERDRPDTLLRSA